MTPTKFSKEKILYILVMCLYGMTGIIKRFIPMSSTFVSVARAVIATVFLLLFIKLSGRKMNFPAVRKCLKWILFIGSLLGVNWILYFEACTYTTVAKASLCYYMSPVIVLMTSPIFFKEKLTAKKIVCILIAIIGMAFISGPFWQGGGEDSKGIIIGLLAAFFYAAVIIASRYTSDAPPYEKTLIQLGTAALILIPYYILTEGLHPIEATVLQWLLILFMGVVITGIGYVIYFEVVSKLDAQTIAIYAYVDPIVSVLLSALVLSEPLGITGTIGAVLIIGSMIISEIWT